MDSLKRVLGLAPRYQRVADTEMVANANSSTTSLAVSAGSTAQVWAPRGCSGWRRVCRSDSRGMSRLQQISYLFLSSHEITCSCVSPLPFATMHASCIPRFAAVRQGHDMLS